MKEYTEQQYKKDDLPLDIIDYAYIDGLNTFMQTAYNCKNNGAVNLLCCLKNFILYAIRNEWIEKNPFRYYKLRIDKTNVKIPLTKSELDTLIHKPMPNERLDKVRDVFCFCCLTGLAFTDTDNLRKEHISTDEHGVVWIHKPREKTSVMSRIPLLPYPISVLRKYERDIETAVRNKLLPVPSNQKMNAYLKEIATICNIDKNLTTHCARHTFATLAIEYGIPIDIIAKILGHTNTNMTRRYAKISEANIGREMKKLGEVMAGDKGFCEKNRVRYGKCSTSARATKYIRNRAVTASYADSCYGTNCPTITNIVDWLHARSWVILCSLWRGSKAERENK